MAPDSVENPQSPAPSSAAYLVLARKYRPQKFADLTGQEHVVRTLTNALKGGRVAHAFLFCGPRGCGKTTSARILARALNCKGPDGKLDHPALEPCGVCGPCLEIAAGTDVDVQEIDAASNNGVDDVRQLREAARYLPARDRYKIYIIDEVHMLSSAAFNALLKTLEEPPGHIKFLLATTDPQKLPATILSRVQRHNFQLVPLGKIVTRLREICAAEKVLVSDGALALVARQALGSMRDALSLLDQLLSAHDPASGEILDAEAAEILGALDARVAADAITAVLRRDAAAALGAVTRAYEAGAEMKRFCEELASYARNLVLAQLGSVPMDLPDHEARELRTTASEHDAAQLSRVFELLQAAQDEVAKAASPRHAIEVALLRAVHLAPGTGLPELLARVEQLAGKMGGVAPAATTLSSDAKPRPAAPPWVSRGVPGSGSGAPLLRADPESQLSAPVKPAPAPPAPAPSQLHASAVAPSASPALAPPAVLAESVVSQPSVQQSSVQQPSVHQSSAPAPTLAEQVAARPIEENWKRLVESVRAMRKAMLTAVLEQALPLELTPSSVILALPRAQARMGLLDDRDNKLALETAFERVLGKKPNIQIREHADSPEQAAQKSLADQKKDAKLRSSNARIALGREHPNVKAAVELLGGEIEDVRDLGEE
jgi:DNA polymerase-3 subunit gamma/tau